MEAPSITPTYHEQLKHAEHAPSIDDFLNAEFADEPKISNKAEIPAPISAQFASENAFDEDILLKALDADLSSPAAVETLSDVRAESVSSGNALENDFNLEDMGLENIGLEDIELAEIAPETLEAPEISDAPVIPTQETPSHQEIPPVTETTNPPLSLEEQIDDTALDLDDNDLSDLDLSDIDLTDEAEFTTVSEPAQKQETELGDSSDTLDLDDIFADDNFSAEIDDAGPIDVVTPVKAEHPDENIEEDIVVAASERPEPLDVPQESVSAAIAAATSLSAGNEGWLGTDPINQQAEIGHVGEPDASESYEGRANPFEDFDIDLNLEMDTPQNVSDAALIDSPDMQDAYNAELDAQTALTMKRMPRLIKRWIMLIFKKTKKRHPNLVVSRLRVLSASGFLRFLAATVQKHNRQWLRLKTKILII